MLTEYSYDTDIITHYDDIVSESDKYLLMMEYFYKFIICTVRDTIKDIIEKFFFFYEHPNDDKMSFTKNALKYILLKFRQFNDYVDYYNDKNNNKFINNLLINKNNLSLNDKINIFSILLNIILSSPIYYENTKIEFFNINLNDKNVYLLANNLLKKIIDKLNPNSQYLKGLKQTFSRIKKDLNILNHKNKKENNSFNI